MEIFLSNRKFFLLILGIALIYCSCSSVQSEPYNLPYNARVLLSGDSVKTWKLAQRYNNRTRMNMGDCFLSYRQTFGFDGTVQDNSGENKDCGETLYGQWKFAKTGEGDYYLKIESDQLPELMNIEEDFKLFKILNLTDSMLTLQFQHKQFSNKTSTITDFLVPESVSVTDRNFHW